MNRWYQVTRMRGAAFLILIGVLALLNQWRILSWDKSWPFFLIVPGLLAIAERAAWAADVRAQREAQLDASFTGPGTGTMGTVGTPIQQAGTANWSGMSESGAAERSFIQTHPPTPEDPEREER